MYFSDLKLHHQLQKALEIQGFKSLTTVQQHAVTKAMQGHDLMVAAKTGSGKTLAFAVPMVNRLLSNKALSKQDARAVILAPTRELAKQVFGVVKKLCDKTRLQVALVIGGENFNDQVKKLKRSPEIVVATAGRLADHLASKHVFLNGLEMLILDEADRMMELGFKQQLNEINAAADHRKRQTMWFSATLDAEVITKMADTLLKSPERIEIDKVETPHSDIVQQFYFSDGPNQKDKQLVSLLPNERTQSLVFVATRDDTERLSTMLSAQKYCAECLHGEMTQGKRNQTLNDFINNKIGVLVTTDLGSRGLDISNIKRVINYDLPKKADEYVHRIGRTGRAGQKGLAFSLVGKRDWWSFINIKDRLKQDIDIQPMDGIKTKFRGVNTKQSPKKPQNVKKAQKTKRSRSNVSAEITDENAGSTMIKRVKR